MNNYGNCTAEDGIAAVFGTMPHGFFSQQLKCKFCWAKVATSNMFKAHAISWQQITPKIAPSATLV